MTYKDAIKKLEEIVNKIENEDPDVDEISGLVKEAYELLTFCKTRLKTTEEEVQEAFEKLRE
ncbi:exonuclease VII small subunit [Flammeovirgaceae bacterium 311]|nr:exonuclease VII small subunit [Flammeovirgaceae bacterium 311]